MNENKEIVLKVNNLKQHFVTGTGKYKISVKAVDGVSFEIARGEVFSLVGESGCGKTTTGRTIMRLYQPTDGEVHLLGNRIVAGYQSVSKQIVDLRRKRKQLKASLKEGQITDKDYVVKDQAIILEIADLKEEIKKRKLDQKNNYIPTKESLEKDKVEAEAKISELNEEIKVLETQIDEIKSSYLTKLGLDQKSSSKKDVNRALENDSEYKNEVADLNQSLRKLKNDVYRYELSYKAGSRSLLNKIQMIFQDPIDSLDPRMTVRDIVAEGLYINGIKDKSIIDEKVYQALRLVGLMPEHAAHYPHEFSGGQRQRVGIARAIVTEPEIIVADEPISALDVSIQAQVINLLNDLKDQLGLTLLFIAHDLSVVKYFSDKVAVMYFGHIVEMGDKDKVFDNPLHPYTKSLISSIPVPNPDFERLRDGIMKYSEDEHNYTADSKVELREVEPGHLVLSSEEELVTYKRIVNENKK